MLKGFKEFLLRGNVLDLAVAVVVGAAFTAIVTAFTENIVNPLVASLGGSNDMGFGFQITDSPETFVNVGAVLSAVINFVLIAAVVYFVLIVPFNSVKERFMTEEEKEATDIELLTEIRNLLADANADAKSTRVES
ncbi:large conductance mechanosensitive channel [Rhodococcus sp. PvR044]|uniref:large-conductance mechanosensitive channel protein MscL n=1 Tax=Rhodococcus TaxID=1827 RepID=UPI000BC411BC|nr:MULTISPECIES: large-conductance mechanosensitive channel protein MscL [Rhodococcus]MBP1161046.1 large conductance mechanosensitive channel [Rhodococcus sp. PvR099]MCZ4557509.1 large-conductance mechanosensitive channel protein MscL [Rhodococcus maanshanensis]PTR39440.1 large conductance mechanosensitive channel [Rhodococcus sp. OK611]SNX92591.1 large conductance mechanosensitive channel [Rhodococcus sp. OK270]